MECTLSLNAAFERVHACNSRPDNIKLDTDTDRFKMLLKSHLFHLAFWTFVNTSGQSALDRFVFTESLWCDDVRWQMRLRQRLMFHLKALTLPWSPSPDPRITWTRHERCWRTHRRLWSDHTCLCYVYWFHTCTLLPSALTTTGFISHLRLKAR